MNLLSDSSLKKLSDQELIQSTKSAIARELTATTNVVRHFAEIFNRRTYAVMGYSSMQRFAVEEMGLDKASAQRRVNAMHLANAVPDVLEMIDSKKLFLQSAADIQTFLNKERGARRPYSAAKKAELVNSCVGKSTRKAQRLLAALNPACDFMESKRFVSADRLQISYTTSVAIEKKLDRLKEVLAHVNPYMSREELIDYIAEIALDKLDPKRKAARSARRDAKKASSRADDGEAGDVPTWKEDPYCEVISSTGPAQVPIPDYKIFEELIGTYGEVQLAVRFDGPLHRSASVVRDGVVPYQGGDVGDRATKGRGVRFSRLRWRVDYPSVRGLTFRRPAEKAASLRFKISDA